MERFAFVRLLSARAWLATGAGGLAVLTLVCAVVAQACIPPSPKTPAELVQELACIENYKKQDYDAAETRCQLCMEYNENNAECLNGLGLVWYARGDDERAKKYWIMAIRRNNDFAQARSNMGVLEFENSNFEEASKYFENAVEIDPRFRPARYNLALSFLRLGQLAVAKERDPTEWYKKAEEQYRRMFELFLEHPSAMSVRGCCPTRCE